MLDLDFDTFLSVFSIEMIDALQAAINRRKANMHPERIRRRVLITKDNQELIKW